MKKQYNAPTVSVYSFEVKEALTADLGDEFSGLLNYDEEVVEW